LSVPVSIIIPAHNAAGFLDKAVASARRQTHQEVEIIIVNDGSSDATGAVARGLAAADPRVIAIDLAETRGVSAARNAALARASGDWVAVLDADDRFAPQRIARLLELAAATGADMVADNLEMRDFSTDAMLGLAFAEDWVGGGDVSLRQVLERDIPGQRPREMGFMKPMIRRALIEAHQIRYVEGLPASEDLLFYVDCLRAGARLRLLDDALYIYSVRPGSISSLGKGNAGSKQANMILLAGLAKEQPAYRPLLMRRLAAVNFQLFIWHVRARDWRSAAAVAAQMPPGFFATKLMTALRRRMLGRH
jgi:glycosyltransferase involved in cell wall biosynthesis